MSNTSMLETLRAISDQLPTLLRRREIWRSLHVLYEPPRVERLWCQLGDLRVFLHKIWPTEAEVLYHPHPWPSAVRVVSGRYLHLVGTAERILATQVLTAGSEYELTDPAAWHSVRPLDEPSDSIMVVGKLYDPPPAMPKPPTERQPPLEDQRVEELLDAWRALLSGVSRAHAAGSPND